MTKLFNMNGSVFTCVIEEKGQYGSIEYDFSTGELRSNRPDNFDNVSWLICCRRFIAICFKMNAPFLD